MRNAPAEYSTIFESLKDENIMVDDALVERHLGVQARERRKKIGIQADMICEVAVLEYQATSPDEIFAITKIHT
jgi:predicted anti-sigma-YlaC factor YlaD